MPSGPEYPQGLWLPLPPAQLRPAGSPSPPPTNQVTHGSMLSCNHSSRPAMQVALYVLLRRIFSQIATSFPQFFYFFTSPCKKPLEVRCHPNPQGLRRRILMCRYNRSRRPNTAASSSRLRYRSGPVPSITPAAWARFQAPSSLDHAGSGSVAAWRSAFWSSW